MIGAKGEHRATVTPAHSAQALGSGSLPVLATPALVAWLEAAAVAALAAHLPPQQSSVGVALDVRHLAPTPIGGQVVAEAEVIEVDGRNITLKVQAWDETERIGEGLHRRVIIDPARFMERVGQKAPSGKMG